MLKQWWRSLSRAKAFNEGHRISVEDHNQHSFKNDFNKLVCMFQIRTYFVNNTPYQSLSDKYTNDQANLQKELNSQQARIMGKRAASLIAIIMFYITFIREEKSMDWKDKFDLKFNLKAYGSLDDSSGEGNVSIDD